MKNTQSLKFKQIRSNILLIIAALIWGSSFVAQDAAMNYIKPFTFASVRFLVGAVVLLPLFILIDKDDVSRADGTHKDKIKNSVIGGIICGAFLFVASTMQQIGIYLGTEAGKAGFITVLYIVLVPLLGLFLKKHVSKTAWMGVIIAPIGLYLLCVKNKSGFELGDIIIALSAIAYAMHILVIDHFSVKINAVLLSCIQFSVVALLSVPFMFIFETPDISGILKSWLPILFTGIMSCGIAYTLQVVAQKYTNPTIASLIMSLESVFAAITGRIILSQTLSIREVIGCSLIFIAIILAQLPSSLRRKNNQ